MELLRLHCEIIDCVVELARCLTLDDTLVLCTNAVGPVAAGLQMERSTPRFERMF
jgi:hypothetical protein